MITYCILNYDRMLDFCQRLTTAKRKILEDPELYPRPEVLQLFCVVIHNVQCSLFRTGRTSWTRSSGGGGSARNLL